MTIQPDYSGLIEGQWQVKEVNYSGTKRRTNYTAGVAGSNDFSGSGYDLDFIIDFKEGSNEYEVIGNYNIHMYEYYGMADHYYDWNEREFLENGTWSLRDDIVNCIPMEGSPEELMIVEATDSMLTLVKSFVSVVQNSSGTQNITYTYNGKGTYVFERQ